MQRRVLLVLVVVLLGGFPGWAGAVERLRIGVSGRLSVHGFADCRFVEATCVAVGRFGEGSAGGLRAGMWDGRVEVGCLDGYVLDGLAGLVGLCGLLLREGVNVSRGLLVDDGRVLAGVAVRWP